MRRMLQFMSVLLVWFVAITVQLAGASGPGLYRAGSKVTNLHQQNFEKVCMRHCDPLRVAILAWSKNDVMMSHSVAVAA